MRVVSAVLLLLGCPASRGRGTLIYALEQAVVFLAGALVVAAGAGLLRTALVVLLEPRGHGLDSWRRRWFHPERELAMFFEALLIVAFVEVFARLYLWPPWAALLIMVLWALHLPSDAWRWWQARGQASTAALHRRGFFLLRRGPLWMRLAAVLLAGGIYLLLPPVRDLLDAAMNFILGSLQGWFA